MKKILENLALIHLNEYGLRHNIDISGTHLAKNGRGFNYSLCKDETGLALITILFNKSSIPTYLIHS